MATESKQCTLKALDSRREDRAPGPGIRKFRLAGYVVAATAGGLTAAYAAQPAPEAGNIVYTPANISFGNFGTGSFPLDLNHDGKVDITIWYSNTSFRSSGGGCAGQNGNVRDVPAVGNGAILTPLLRGAVIGGADSFKGGKSRMAYGFEDGCSGHGSYGFGGPFANVTDEYLGVRFLINGQTHYGWVRVSITASVAHVSGSISGYAYNTVPNQIIIAGEGTVPSHSKPIPASLGLLSQGANGLRYWRK
jgi:hypothetical protein